MFFQEFKIPEYSSKLGMTDQCSNLWGRVWIPSIYFSFTNEEPICNIVEIGPLLQILKATFLFVILDRYKVV